MYVRKNLVDCILVVAILVLCPYNVFTATAEQDESIIKSEDVALIVATDAKIDATVHEDFATREAHRGDPSVRITQFPNAGNVETRRAILAGLANKATWILGF